MKKLRINKISVTIEQLCKGYPKEFVRFFESWRNLGFEDKPDYSGYRRMFSDLMTQEGYSYDFVYDWLMKKSERETLRGAITADEEEKKETRKMTKAEKFRSTQENYKKKVSDAPHEEKKIPKEPSTLKTDSRKPKETTKGSKRRKTYNLKETSKEEQKKPDIYSAMKDSGFGSAKPKIVTNNVRSYRY